MMKSVIDIQSLSFSYDHKATKNNILDNLDLVIHQGELTCLLGANGAGKTTLINILLGRLTQQQGTISLFGKQQSISNVRHRIGAMLQNSTAPERALVIELLTLFSSYYPNPIDLEQLIAQLELTPLLTTQFSRLSGGQKQLVLLALALCGNPDVLFLDEPSVGMDVSTRRVLWQVIEQQKQCGKTIVLTTHYLEEADALADRVVVLQGGNVIADGSPQQLKSRFNSQTIKAKTRLPEEQIATFDSVQNITQCGQYVEVTTVNTAATLQQWLALEPELSAISVTQTNLEQAFLQITQSTQSITQPSTQSSTTTMENVA